MGASLGNAINGILDGLSSAAGEEEDPCSTDPKIDNQKNNPPPQDDIHWDSAKNRWVDSENRVITRHNWGPEPAHWDRGSADGTIQEKSYDGKKWIRK